MKTKEDSRFGQSTKDGNLKNEKGSKQKSDPKKKPDTRKTSK